MMMEKVLSVEGIGKKFRDVQAIRDIHFDVHAGEIMAILGPNGAGKSTTIRNIMGIIIPNEGTIRFHRSKDGPSLAIKSDTCRKSAAFTKMCRSWI